jgi:hypothetical protein
MGGPVIVRNVLDAYVSERYPTRNYSNVNKMYLVGSVSANNNYGLIYWGRPFPLGAKIISAKLRLKNGGVWSGSVTMTVRRIAKSWSTGRVTWNTKPTVTTPVVSVTKSNAPSASTWEFDLTQMMQAVSDGGVWYGVRVEINLNTGSRWIYSAQSPYASTRPEFEVTWADNPVAPEVLHPADNRSVSTDKPVLSFDFTDVSGDRTMAGAQVQIDPAANWTTPAWDSAGDPDVDNLTEPQVDLTLTDYPGLAAGSSTWWRVRTKDGAGLWSDWSDGEQFKHTPLGTVTITNPPPGGPVEDVTPTIFWTFSGVQKSYQVVITDPDTFEILWTSGKLTDTVQEQAIPAGVIANVADSYRLHVFVWDDVDRVQEGNRQIYAEAIRDFVFTPTTAVTPTTNLVVEKDGVWPWPKLTWDRTSLPDMFRIVRDGRIIFSTEDPQELQTDVDSYEFLDRTSPPRTSHTWEVIAVVNNQASASNSKVTKTIHTHWSWLLRPDGSDVIALLKAGNEKSPVVAPQSSQLQEVHEPIGGTSPVLVTQYVRGYQGHVQAVLSDDILPGVTARQQRDRYKKFMAEKGTVLILFWVDEVMKVVCYNMIYRPRAVSGEKMLYDVEFDFFEVD